MVTRNKQVVVAGFLLSVAVLAGCGGSDGNGMKGGGSRDRRRNSNWNRWSIRFTTPTDLSAGNG